MNSINCRDLGSFSGQGMQDVVENVKQTGFFLSTVGFPSQHHSINGPHSSSSYMFFLKEGLTGKAWELSTKQCLSM